MKITSKITKITFILLLIFFWTTIISSCSKSLVPPEGLISEETVGETASSKWVANEEPQDKGKSFESKAEPFTGPEFAGSEKEAQVSDLNFKTSGKLEDIHLDSINMILMKYHVRF